MLQFITSPYCSLFFGTIPHGMQGLLIATNSSHHLSVPYFWHPSTRNARFLNCANSSHHLIVLYFLAPFYTECKVYYLIQFITSPYCSLIFGTLPHGMQGLLLDPIHHITLLFLNFWHPSTRNTRFINCPNSSHPLIVL